MPLGDQNPRILEVQYLGALRKNKPANEQVQINGNETISEIIARLNISRELIGVAILDEDFVGFDAKVENGSTLKLLSFVGGG